MGIAAFCLKLIVFVHLHYAFSSVYRNCGGILRSEKGIIQSPNFPKEFPTPIRCEWVIHNQKTPVTLIHFTQFYLTNYFTVQFFQEYTNSENYRNESKMEIMNAYHDVYSLEIRAPFVVLRFGVYQMGDINIRVLEHMIDVYGFNITYEFVEKGASSEKVTCTAYHCSYLGSCLASADFSEYRCHCAENFFGEFCQYGPDCNPLTKTNRCQNGGICSYLNGSLNYVCECPYGYTGEWCEVKQDECYFLACDQICVEILPGKMGCGCQDGYRLNTDGQTCSVEELQIVDMVTGNGGGGYEAYTNENQFLTISCIVKGDNSTRFRWYKDGMLVDFSISPRSAYHRVFMSSTEGIIRSVLYFAQVKKYDEGYFTCVAAADTTEKRRSTYVAVQSTPLIYVPKTELVKSPNASVRIPCFSINEPYNSFLYKWFENGVPIKWHTPNRIPETLLPAGSQLVAKGITKNTKFTCQVTNRVGERNVTIHVFIAKDIHLVCPSEIYIDILWPETEKDHFTKQSCPPKFGGFAERSCIYDNSSKICRWTEPNLLNCQSNELIQIYDKVEVLRQGYRSTTITKILKELHLFAQIQNATINVGDAELLTSVLRRILEYMWAFPKVATTDERISFEDIINIMDRLLTVTKDLSSNIKKRLTLGINILNISAFFARKFFKQLFHVEIGDGIITENIDFQELGSQRSKSIVSNKGVTLTSFRFRNLESHLSAQSSLKIPGMSFISDIEAVYTEQSLSSALYQRLDIVSANISMNIGKQSDIKEYACFSWERNKRQPQKYSWRNNSCSIVSIATEAVTCQCDLPVLLTIAGLVPNTTIPFDKSSSQTSLVVILSHVISIFGLLVCIFIFARNWRYLIGEHYVFYLSFNIVLFLNNIVFLMCHVGMENKILWLIGEIAAYFFYISAFSFVLLEIFHFFILTSTSKEYKAEKRCSRFIIIGLGIPMILTVFFSTTSTVFPKFPSDEKLMICWISKSAWQFYVFMLPVTFIIMAFLVFTAVVWRIRVKLTEESEVLFKRRLRFIFLKSLILMSLTLTEAVLGMDLANDNLSQIALYFTSKICLSIRQKKWFKGLFLSEDKKYRSEMEARRYYDEVNRAKYTREKKKELSFLLGSSNSNSRCEKRQNGADNNGTGSSRTTDTSMDTNITDVNSDREDNNESKENTRNNVEAQNRELTIEGVFSSHKLPMESASKKAEERTLNSDLTILETVEVTALIHYIDKNVDVI
ncbi:uncharacterized protein LOC134245546 [Saccostrea cucullata]|uniref:uncharacterized protein LOC134245546 n=1 Tax=Saccostrea cuccullata TaxID=36930 RepID=UPI002ED5D829